MKWERRIKRIKRWKIKRNVYCKLIIIVINETFDFSHNFCCCSGMYNGTHLIIIKMEKYALERKVILGSGKIYIHKLSLTHSDIRILFKFQCREFPIALTFAMTINNS